MEKIIWSLILSLNICYEKASNGMASHMSMRAKRNNGLLSFIICMSFIIGNGYGYTAEKPVALVSIGSFGLIKSQSQRGLPWLSVVGSEIRDEFGTVFKVKGITFSARSYYQDCANYSKMIEHYRRIKDAGFNTVFLRILWEWIEPKVGVWNDLYFSGTVDVHVHAAADCGLYIILDMDQRWLSSHFNPPEGIGMPDWCASSYTPDSDGFKQAFVDFWKDNSGTQMAGKQDRWISALLHVVERYKDKSNVLGFNLMNEPGRNFHTNWGWGGFTQEQFASCLLSYQERAIDAIRSVDNKHVVMVQGGVSLDKDSAKYSLKPNRPNIVWGDHCYYPYLTAYDHSSQFATLDSYIRNASNKYEETFAQPWIISEFGKPLEEGGTLDWYSDVMYLCSKYNLAGWIVHTYYLEDAGYGLWYSDGQPKQSLSILR